MSWALATIAVLLIGYATASRRLQLLSVSGAMFFTTAGLLVGPVLGLLDFRVESELVKRLAEITLTLVLFADAARISLADVVVRKHAEARVLDAVQERVHCGTTALDPAREAVATGARVLGWSIDRLRRATFDHLYLDATAFQRAVLERRGDRGPDLGDRRRFGGNLEFGHGARFFTSMGGRMTPAERTLLRPDLQALAERPGDGVAGRAHSELGLQAREPLADGMKAQE
jgi:hypothetical protein